MRRQTLCVPTLALNKLISEQASYNTNMTSLARDVEVAYLAHQRRLRWK